MAMNIALPKNDVDPIAWPLGKLNPDISINRNNVGRSRSKYSSVMDLIYLKET